MNDPKEFNNFNEIKRLQSLYSYNILDTPAEEEFDGLAKLIAAICKAPTAIISFIDDKRQWYKAKVGTDLNEVPREESFCRYTVLQDDLMEVPDARKDERFCNNPHVTAGGGIRFYVAVPIKAADGNNIGTLCAVDSEPRELDAGQKKALKLLSKQVMLLVEARTKNSILGEELQNIIREKSDETRKLLLQKETEYNFLLKAIKKSSAVVEFSPDGTIVAVNRNFTDLMGYSREEIVGRHHTVLVPEEGRTANGEFWSSLRAGKFKTGRLKRLHKSGAEIWLQATYNPIFDLDNKLVKVIKIAQNITTEVEAEKAVKKSRDLAEEFSLKKDHFIANVSHEIRTPIHAMLGFTELLLEQESDKLKKNYLQSVKTAGDNLLFIVNDILDLSKIETGLIMLEKQPFRLTDTVRSVFSMLHLKAHQKKLQFKSYLDQDIPEILLGDMNRLSQILINLLGNALKFTGSGKVELFVQLSQLREKTVVLEFKVTDTGIGIAADKLSSIFERFTQAEESTTRTYGGTGLGLNISKQLIEKQNGSIEVSSEEGTGSVFTFTIPYEIAEEEEIREPVTTYSLAPSKTGGKILLCEDNELNQRLIKAILTEKGYVVDLAENGNKGLEFLEQNSYDLVLMDIQMPQKDGYQTSTEMRELYNLKVPIVALTANFLQLEREKCLQAGMNDYLSKPFTKEKLLNVVAYWLQNSGTAQNETREIKLPEKKQAVLSFEILQELSEGNKEFEKEMLNLFLQQGESAIDEFRILLKKRDYESIRTTAHRLKTSFGITGADMDILHSLQNIENNTSYKAVEQLINSLIAQLEEIFSILKDPAALKFYTGH